MLLNPEPYLTPAFKDGMHAWIRVKRGFMRAAEARQVVQDNPPHLGIGAPSSFQRLL